MDSWAGYLDNSVAGGIPSGMGVLEALVKESWEEAGLDGELVASKARPAGAVSYVHRSPAGWLQPEIEYVYDLVDASIVPRPVDGEVASFEVSALASVVGDALTRERPAHGPGHCD